MINQKGNFKKFIRAFTQLINKAKLSTLQYNTSKECLKAMMKRIIWPLPETLKVISYHNNLKKKFSLAKIRLIINLNLRIKTLACNTSLKDNQRMIKILYDSTYLINQHMISKKKKRFFLSSWSFRNKKDKNSLNLSK